MSAELIGNESLKSASEISLRRNKNIVAKMEDEPQKKTNSREEQKGKSSFLERLKILGCTVQLFHYKVLFFASYGAFGCLMTFLPLYFKQLGLSAAQTGLLVGIRPLCQAIGAPFWGILADKYKRRKAILLLGASAWLIKNMLILVIRPSHQVCVATVGNESHIVTKRDSLVDSQHKAVRVPLSSTVHTALALTGTPDKEKYFIQVDNGELLNIFYILLVLVIIGELFGSILHPILDGCTVDFLGNERKSYGRLRFWGSVGMVVTSLSVGLVINHYTRQYCGEIRKNYSIAFYFFAGFMAVTIAFLFSVKIVYCEGPKQSLSAIKELFNSRVKFSFWFAAISLGISDGFQSDFNSWFLDDLKASSFEVGLAAALHFVLSALCYFVANFALERLGYIITIAAGLVFYIVLFIGFSFAQSAWVAIVFYVIIGGVFAVFWTACVAYVGAMASPLGLGAAGQGK